MENPTPPPPPPQNVHLQRLLDANDEFPVEVLESGVKQGAALLQEFGDSMSRKSHISRDAAQWLTQIENLRKQAVKGRTVIGVVGNTGAGKSSVINAMLDEERLVPTNCMRACTAVVTEISWNDSDDPDLRYRAQIEFIKEEDWAKELAVLFKDLIDQSGEVSRDCTNADSDAGIAYAKIKAVYPRLTKEMIAESSVEQLLRHSDVRAVLGTTKTIEQDESGPFYKHLQLYVDSKEKVSNEEGESQKKGKSAKKMEYWPLIRVVKIYTKSAALSTGAVVVDLPGVQDSNSARAAVAEGYMKQCTGLWIVAPINRAVDDKAAKNLLGQQFKRQMKYDGTYANVTFICSKTDDISITEAADTLGLDEQIQESYGEAQDLRYEIQKLEKEADELLKTREMYTDIIDDTSTQLEQWRDLEDKLEAGNPVYAPREKKRKRTKDHKRRNRDLFDSQDLDFDSDDASDDESDNEDDVQELPLTAEQISTKLEQLKDQRSEAKRQKEDIIDKRKAMSKRLKEAKARLAELKSEMSAVCIEGRNKYSKKAIQQDFAAGIKELDQEMAIEEDEANFDPEVDLRDYDQVATSLPVFCVSSRAYQKLSGRLEKDSAVSGFTTVEQTEVPQLQDHCRKLTESGRIASARAFLNQLSQLFNSLALWSADTGNGTFMSAAQREARATFLEGQLKKLEQNLTEALNDCVGETGKNFEESICEQYPAAIANAASHAGPTRMRWGAHRLEGGYHWSTYKAIVRRDGVAEPLLKHLSGGWERAFQRRLPIILNEFTSRASRLLHDFHKVVETEARLQGVGFAGMGMLAQQLNSYSQSFRNAAGQMVNVITEMQRTANREFTPVIKDHLLPAYETCTNERGTGSFARMKHAMGSYIAAEQNTMFRHATDTVKKHLDSICQTVHDQMGKQTMYVLQAMRRDY
ncbi:hypothetical protein NA57DRAFT_35654, partial [Rhizodiscina lignyota]